MKNIFYSLLFFTLITTQIFSQIEEDTDSEKEKIQPQKITRLELPVTDINPDNYFIGAGDIFFISVRGVISEDFKVPVNPEGTLFIPKTGVIAVKDLLLVDAKTKIKNEIMRYYTGVDIDISLIGVRNIKVRVIGFLENPEEFVLPANTLLSGLVEQLPEMDNMVDLRNIEVIFNNDSLAIFDIMSFYRLNETNENPCLSNVKTVRLTKTDRFIAVYGNVVDSRIYPYKKGESVKHAIDLAGGFLSNAKKDTIEVISFDEKNENLYSTFYPLAEINSGLILLKPSDKIVVRKIPEFKIDRMVEIKGEVQYPGMFKIKKDETTLYELITQYAGGFTQDASLQDAYVERNIGTDKPDPELERLKSIPRSELTEDEYEYLKARSRERKGRMVVNFENLFVNNDLSEDLILRREDVIVIPEKIDYVSLVGQVVKPGNIIYDRKYSIDDYIAIAGGFSWKAVDDDIRVIKSSSGEWIEADDVEELQPGDIIWVPEEAPSPKFWDVFMDTMTVLAQIAAVVTSVVAIAVATR